RVGPSLDRRRARVRPPPTPALDSRAPRHAAPGAVGRGRRGLSLHRDAPALREGYRLVRRPPPGLGKSVAPAGSADYHATVPPPPRVSVVVPSYNAERFLAAALDSALAQTAVALDVIVVHALARDPP